MNVDFTCSCQMKIDLENSADVFSFFEEYLHCLSSYQRFTLCLPFPSTNFERNYSPVFFAMKNV